MVSEKSAGTVENQKMGDVASVSVIVPCYNCASYIGACLDSLLSQELEPTEIICVNDGSTDATAEILRQYAREFGIVKVITKSNEGAWMARLDGIAAATGSFIAFVDGDDTVDSRYLSLLYACASNNDADIAVCGFYRKSDKDGAVLSEEFIDARAPFLISEHPEELISVNPAPWNKLFRAEVLKSIPSISFRPVMFDDLVLLLLAATVAKRRVAFAPEALVNYFVHPESLINNVSPAQMDGARRALQEVRTVYEKMDLPSEYLEMLSVAAFIHLGVSMQFRIDGGAGDVTSSVSAAKRFLDSEFPEWRASRYLGMRYCCSKGGVYPKAFAAALAYKLHVFAPLIRAYRWLMQKRSSTVSW